MSSNRLASNPNLSLSYNEVNWFFRDVENSKAELDNSILHFYLHHELSRFKNISRNLISLDFLRYLSSTLAIGPSTTSTANMWPASDQSDEDGGHRGCDPQ